ncbi:MAG: AMP-binding protein [Sphingomonadaceae bacterium]|nr:AMP-binding protein [Sphingomonadaceae bacterium]
MQPDKPAIITAFGGESITFGELEDQANRVAQLFRKLGLERGDTFALLAANSIEFIEIGTAMQRTGLYEVPIASRLNAEEAAHIINDCEARVCIVDAQVKHAETLARDFKALCPNVEHAFSMNGDLAGMDRWETAVAKMPAELIDDPSLGNAMIYSSGTTGKPKGVRHALPDGEYGQPSQHISLMVDWYKIQPGMDFIISAPMYHSGANSFSLSILALGGTVLLFEKFDAEKMLQVIDRYKPQGGQFVPTMFTRMLKLPQDVIEKYDVSSLVLALHSAAPCPVDVKRAMIEWWGPIFLDIYGGAESVGFCQIGSEEWLKKPGSVGRPTHGILHICDEEGNDLPVGENGVIYFENPDAVSFEYLKDDEKTKGSRNPQRPSWTTYGDIGHVDEDGYLFLTDRRSFMIVAGGVNIYPQEAENVLSMHPKITDVVVFGVPDPDMGEQVKAIIEPADWNTAGPELERELIDYCKSRLATLKCPKTIDFNQQLPRDDNGKISKKALRDSYWPS